MAERKLSLRLTPSNASKSDYLNLIIVDEYGTQIDSKISEEYFTKLKEVFKRTYGSDILLIEYWVEAYRWVIVPDNASDNKELFENYIVQTNRFIANLIKNLDNFDMLERMYGSRFAERILLGLIPLWVSIGSNDLFRHQKQVLSSKLYEELNNRSNSLEGINELLKKVSIKALYQSPYKPKYTIKQKANIAMWEMIPQVVLMKFGVENYEDLVKILIQYNKS